MNKKEMKDKWVTALRSGNYNQAKFSFHTDTGFCCLGVAAVEWELSTPEKLSDCTENYSAHISEVHSKIQNIFGYSGLECTLMTMNDEQGYSFPEIANYIETNWEV